jgi:hypothetical protein
MKPCIVKISISDQKAVDKYFAKHLAVADASSGEDFNWDVGENNDKPVICCKKAPTQKHIVVKQGMASITRSGTRSE